MLNGEIAVQDKNGVPITSARCNDEADQLVQQAVDLAHYRQALNLLCNGRPSTAEV